MIPAPSKVAAGARQVRHLITVDEGQANAKDHSVLVVRRQSRRGHEIFTSDFKNSKPGKVRAPMETAGLVRRNGDDRDVQIEGQEFYAYETAVRCSISHRRSRFFVNCETQEEVDELWTKLCEGGMPNRCGWLQDKLGFVAESFQGFG